MSGNPFFPLDEMGFDAEENQTMVIPKVDNEIYEKRRRMVGTMVDLSLIHISEPTRQYS